MLGLTDIWVEMAIILSGVITLICVVYGILNWSRDTSSPALSNSTIIWGRDEKKIEDL